jgi:ATP-dependent helicase HrpB
LQGAASSARILSAAPITDIEVMALFGDRIVTSTDTRYDGVADRVEIRQRRRLGSIVLVEGMADKPDQAAVAQALINAVRSSGLSVLPWSHAATALRQRANYAGDDSISDAVLMGTMEQWLLPLLQGVNRLRDISKSGLSAALDEILGWDGKQRIERVAPAAFTSPAGTTHEIDYAAEAGPTVELRVQALFGLDSHPAVGVDPVPLVLSLTSPAGRPIQTTRNLPDFWRGSWRDVAKEMRGRYPKHNWPDAPWESVASLKTKKAQSRDQARGA